MVRGMLALAFVACNGEGGSDGPTDGDDTGTPPTPVDPYDYHTVELSVELTDEDLDGTRISHWIPDQPKAVLFAFHGTNGDVNTVLNTEWLVLYNLLVPHDVGLVLANSQNRDTEQWDVNDEDPTTNPDMVFLTEARDYLIATTALEASTPVASAGFSNGASFANLFISMADRSGWDVRGYLAHQGGAQYENSPVPGFYVSAENDEQGLTPDRIGPAAEQCEAFTGGACPHRIGHEIALHPNRLARMPYFTQEQSQAVFDELVAIGTVDQDGERLVDISEDLERVLVDIVNQLDFINKNWVDEDLRVVWATHRFSAEHAVEEANWLLDRL